MHSGSICIARKQRGTAVIDLVPTLWLVFFILTFPLSAYCSVGLRYVFVSQIARLAASEGAQSKTYQTNVSSTDLSAVNMANQVLTNTIAHFPGITSATVSTCIVIAPLSGGAATRQSTVLSSPANTSTNSYDFEVELTAQLEPLLKNSSMFTGAIPGLTAPLPIKARADAFFESPQGLAQ